MEMEKFLLEKKFVPIDGNENFSYVWERGQWKIFFDTSSSLDLFIKNYKGKWIHLHGIFGYENFDHPELGLKNVFEKYGI